MYFPLPSPKADSISLDKGSGPSLISQYTNKNGCREMNNFFTYFERDKDLEGELMDFCHILKREHLSPNQPFISKILIDGLDKRFNLLLDEEVQAAINHVLISLKGYYESDNSVIPFTELKYLAFSIEGSAYLKKLRKLSYVNSINGSFYTDPDWIPGFQSYEIKEIGNIFNYQYCFPWQAEDSQDYLISLTPVETTEEGLDLFRQKLRSMLFEAPEIEPLNELEVLLNLSSSVSQDNGKKNFHYLAKHKHLTFNKKRKAGRRTFVTTAPGDGRDAIINEVEDLNTIQYIEYQLDILLQSSYFRDFLVERNDEVFNKKYLQFIEDNNFFLMRDIKKEGLTKPKILLKIMLEELHNRYPECKAFSFTNFYDGPWYENDTSARGHGLGMANNLTTLMQIVCFSMLIELTAESGLDIKYDMICHNDDIIIGVKCSHEDLDDAINLDCSVLESLGILISRDKSFTSPYGGVICERYADRIDGFHKKQSYINREKLILFTCCNVTHMKSMLSSFYSKFEFDINLGELISYFGYEFHPDEFDMPISIGGWRRSKSLRCSFDLKYMQENFSKRRGKIYLASKANKLSVKYKRRKKENFIPPVLSLFPSKLWENVDPEVLESFNIVSDSKAKNLFTRLKQSPSLRMQAWISLYKKRQKIYNQNTFLTFEMVHDMEYTVLKNIFPIESDIDRWVDIKVIKETLKDPYNVPNPICSALNKIFNLKDDRYNSCFWPLKAKTHDNILRAGARKDLARIINYVPPIYLWEEECTILPLDPKDFEDFMLSYPAPFLMGKVFEIYGKIPILKRKIVKDTWDFKMTEDIMIIYNNVRAEHLKMCVDTMHKFNFDLDEVLTIYKHCSPDFKPIRAAPEVETPGYEEDDMEDLIKLLKSEYLTQLSWEESWEAVSNIENKGFAAFDEIYFKLDDTMKDIVNLAKDIYSQMEVDKLLVYDSKEGEAVKLIKKFNEDYPDFMELFGFELTKSHESESDDAGEGQWGDFNPDDFT